MKIRKNNSGNMLIIVLVLTGIFLIMTIGAISLGLLQLKLNKQKILYEQALQVAEAGASYYRWVLYHDNDNYSNNETPISAPDYGPYGPYPYQDTTGNITGYYNLYITPPAINGSTIVTIKSVGWLAENPNIKRTIEVKCGMPAWSSYSILSGSELRIGEGTEIWGPLHSNGGIRFDGITHNLITSSVLDYGDPDHGGAHEFGVHTHKTTIDPLPDGNNPPQNIPDRPDVFMAGREFPVPSISFSLLDNYATNVLTLAAQNGIVLDPSGSQGYHLTLDTNDQIIIQKVTGVSSTCSSDPTDKITAESYVTTTSTPTNGIIYVKDKVWIDGQVDSNRITILAFKDPVTGNNTDIVINNDLLYTNYNGTDAIGLIAQRDINIGLYSDNDLRIDAALIAKGGRVGRYEFANNNSGACSTTFYKRNSITIYGALASRNRYGFTWTSGSGYQNKYINFDNNLTYSPPPHFPTTGEYTFISWEEK